MPIHIVSRGDTVGGIARQYGVSPQRIISDNNIRYPRNLPLGQALIVLIPETVYTVQLGDTLNSIARRFRTTVAQLLQNNPFLTSGAFLRPGQEIVIKFQGEKIREVVVNGYAYPFIQRSLLRSTLPFLTYLTIFGYGFREDGSLIAIDDQWMINLAYQYQTAPVMLLSSLTEEGNFNDVRTRQLLLNVQLQETVLNNVTKLMIEKGYVGLDIDFEFIRPQEEEAYLAFLRRAAEQMHKNGFFINTDLAPKTSSEQRGLLYEAHDYAAVGEISDTVLLMTYEWGYTYGPPMAVAPLNRVREVVEYAVTQIPPSKILMGIPNYGYDWTLPFERGITQAVSIGNTYAVEIASRYGSEIQYDEEAQSPFFEYTANGRKHIVWFEDVRSIQAKYGLMDEAQLLGGGYWNLMRPFTQNWAFVAASYYIRKVV